MPTHTISHESLARVSADGSGLRVLYSFPMRIGAGQICHIAWQQVAGVCNAGVKVLAAVGSVAKPLPENVETRTTLSAGPFRLPMRWLGRLRLCEYHDRRVAAMLPSLKGKIDLIHGWPLASLHTARAARRLGIPLVIERPNTHTRNAFAVVEQECKRIGYQLPGAHEHAFNLETLAREEAEYEASTALLCPSGYVKRSFTDLGFDRTKLLCHQYGFDDARFKPVAGRLGRDNGLIMIFVGWCAPRKGVHLAVEAWLKSGAAERGRFLICGGFVDGYRELLADQLNHPSIELLGHRDDVDELMRQSDVFVLPSVEEGSALVTYEARASGCVLLVSDATGAVCTHEHEGLVHRAGDVDELASHIAKLDKDRTLLEAFRTTSLSGVGDLTWNASGRVLAACYSQAVSMHRSAIPV